MLITEWKVQLIKVGGVVIARFIRRSSRLLASFCVRIEGRFKFFFDFNFFSCKFF